jgi:hypothetical protein
MRGMCTTFSVIPGRRHQVANPESGAGFRVRLLLLAPRNDGVLEA